LIDGDKQEREDPDDGGQNYKSDCTPFERKLGILSPPPCCLTLITMAHSLLVFLLTEA
jgi:hypothetical protein